MASNARSLTSGLLLLTAFTLSTTIPQDLGAAVLGPDAAVSQLRDLNSAFRYTVPTAEKAYQLAQIN